MKQLEILTSKSLFNLENIFIKNPEIINLSFSELVKKYNLSLTTRYEFNDKISLINPEKKDLKDRENSKMILNILPNLSPAEATDERLWVTLSLNQFKKYTLIRWPVKKDFKLHFFLKSGWRQRIRDNSISRLWWMGHLINRISDIDPKLNVDDYIDILLENTDYRASLIERSSSANCTHVFLTILQITKEQENNGIYYHRPKFREFMKRVDFIEKRRFLPSYEIEDLKKVLTSHYVESYR